MRRIVVCVFFFLIFISNNLCYGQSACGEFIHPDDCEIDIDDPNAPLDSGVGLLIGAAALYTIKKIRERKESNNDISEME